MIKSEQQRHFTYIRLSEYIRQFLRIKYGGEPVLLPESHPCMGVMDKLMVRTPTMKPVHANSLCEALMDEYMHSQVDNPTYHIPSSEERKEYLRVVIPTHIRKYTSCIPTDGFWQLTKDGVCKFRKLVKDEFWNDCFGFISECFSRAHARCEVVTREDAMSDFMTVYDIPMDLFETMLRYYTRERTRMRKQIEQRRDLLQSRSGNKMLYT